MRTTYYIPESKIEVLKVQLRGLDTDCVRFLSDRAIIYVTEITDPRIQSIAHHYGTIL